MYDSLPAVFLLGPPHSGKSVLAFSLSQALRQRKVLHYLLRAAPDGEGDWFAEGPLGVVRTLRFKHQYTPAFVKRVARHLRGRMVPLLVDPGGRPTPVQLEHIFAQATHAILLLPRGADRSPWEKLLSTYAISLLADLTSALEGKDEVSETTPVLRGQITGLVRGTRARGPVFEALVDRLETLFRQAGEGLHAWHLAQAPRGYQVVDLETLIDVLHPEDRRWRPRDLPLLAQKIPRGVPLALYGRAPNWVYGWGAQQAWPAPATLFDVRYGWLPIPSLRPGRHKMITAVEGHWEEWHHVAFRLKESLLAYEKSLRLPLPSVSGTKVILEGKLPFWLLTALVRHYRAQGKSVAVYQPPLSAAVVVTSSSNSSLSLGDTLPVTSLLATLEKTESP